MRFVKIIIALAIASIVLSCTCSASVSSMGIPGTPKMPFKSMLGLLNDKQETGDQQIATQQQPQQQAQQPAISPPSLQTPAVQQPGGVASPESEIFTLQVSGNIYYDKIPVQGAKVSIYHNGKYKGECEAGDIYMFKLPGVKVGDKIDIVAEYEGATGKASETVKFKTMYVNVYVKSGQSFIRRALDFLPTKDELEKSQESQASAAQTETQQPVAQQPSAQQSTGNQGSAGSSPGGFSQSTTNADANELSKNVNDQTWNTIMNSMNQAVQAVQST